MAIPWLVVLKSVPWSDVIRNAPAVVEGARKLWSTVSKQPAVEVEVSEGTGTLAADSPAQDHALLQVRLTGLESAIEELHTQMVASTELIKTLAEQNTQLIGRVEANRVRMVWLLALTVVVGVVAVAALVLVLRG